MTRCSGSLVFVLWALVAFHAGAGEVKVSAEYPEFYNGDTTKGIEFVQAIKVLAPRWTPSNATAATGRRTPTTAASTA